MSEQKYDFSPTERIHSIAIIDGHECKSETSFKLDEKTTKLVFIVADERAKDFIKNTVGENKSLAVKFSGDSNAYGIYSNCDVKINRILSDIDSFAEVEYLITERTPKSIGDLKVTIDGKEAAEMVRKEIEKYERRTKRM